MGSISVVRVLFLGVFIFLAGAVQAQESFREQLRIFDREDIHSIHKRLFTKHGRHEVSLHTGGILNNNGFVLVTGAYQYHFFESLGFEVAAGGYGFQIGADEKLLFGQSSLSFSPIYGKISWFTWAVLNFDLYMIAGGGFVNYSGLTSGTAFMGNVGLGTRLFINEFLSTRIEFRDYIYNRNVGNATEITHNFALTAGISVLFPFRQDL